MRYSQLDMTTSSTQMQKKLQLASVSGTSSLLSAEEQQVNTLADTCAEVYNTRELERGRKVLQQLQESYPDVPEDLFLAAIHRALTWQRQGGDGLNSVN